MRSVHVLRIALAAVVLTSAAPTFAQVDLTGEWVTPRVAAAAGTGAGGQQLEDGEHRAEGPELGDYTGLPINDFARKKAESWTASVIAEPERQANPHPAQYSIRGGGGPNLRIAKIIDPVTTEWLGYQVDGFYGGANRTIWLDNRAHPGEYAEHTWDGFSTGKWEGHMLTVTTTHMKQGFVQRNGVTSSPYGTMTEHIVRHGDYLTFITYVDDPRYLEEPLMRSVTLVRAPRQNVGPPIAFDPSDELGNRPLGWVPHDPPGTHHAEFAEKHGIPFEATQGGKATTYPEYQLRIAELRKNRATPPEAERLIAHASPTATGQIEARPVQGGVHMIAGVGGNITLQVGPLGVLVVDTGGEGLSDKVLAAIRSVSTKPIRYVINTNADADHVGGNAAVSLAGRPAPGTGQGLGENNAAIIAREEVLNRLSAPSGKQGLVPDEALPTTTFFTPKKTMMFNDDPIEIIWQTAAHSDGDVFVFFRGSDVVSVGDVMSTLSYPTIDVEKGGSIQGEIDALNRIIDITIPRLNQMGGTRVIPGHGRICNEADVVEYRDMVTIIRDRVQDLVRKGQTLEQIQTARPTYEYDPMYGSVPTWTPQMFVEAIYKSLTAKPSAK